MKLSVFHIAAVIMSVILVMSCSNSLWYSGTDTGEISLRLELPETSLAGTDTSRALALQGAGIFIEIADIQDVAAYTDPNNNGNPDESLFYQIPEGDGNWVETDWGGHAVVHADLLGTGELSVVFNNVPRDHDLLIRVIQDTSMTEIVSNMPLYATDWYPISQTFLSTATGEEPWKDMGVTVSSDELATGIVNVVLRPNDVILNELTADSGGLVSKFVSGPDPYSIEPDPGYTKFSSIRLDMSGDDNNNVNPGMLVGYRIDMLVPGSPMPGVVALYDSTGRLVPPMVVKTESTFVSAYSIIPITMAAGTSINTGYFIGSTVIPGIDLDNQLLYSAFDVTVTPFVNGTAGTDFAVFIDNALSSHKVFWSPPDSIAQIVEIGDLEYQVLYWSGSNMPSENPYSMDDLMSLNPFVVQDWTAVPLPSSDDAFQFETLNVKSVLGASLDPATTDYYLTAVLARLPGGTPFIIAADYAQYPQF